MPTTGSRWLAALLAVLTIFFVVTAAAFFASSHPRRGALAVVLAVACALGGLFVWVRARTDTR